MLNIVPITFAKWEALVFSDYRTVKNELWGSPSVFYVSWMWLNQAGKHEDENLKGECDPMFSLPFPTP